MQLGITPWDFGHRGARHLVEQAAHAEMLGYESFWLPESHFNTGAIPDPLMLLAAVAAGTRTIRLATTSYLLPLRHPLQAAEQVAVLDQLSEGRVTLGIGRGYAPLMLKAFSVRPSEKRQRFERCLETMRLAWSGDPVPLTDDPDTDSVVLDPLPVQRPHPPLWVAAFGPKALAQAGRLGLPYLASPVEALATLTENYDRHALAAADAGHDDVGAVPVMRTVFVTGDARLASRLRDSITAQATTSGRLSAGASVDDWCIVGDSGYVEDKIAEYREQLKVTHLIVTRLRISGINATALRDSIEQVPGLIS
jgi:alkanesulfonate monooxygenase SsuD/methylene tetrahydromethanopterin reductase-like flavin-dependent oxidoreductase (luciferase family)